MCGIYLFIVPDIFKDVFVYNNMIHYHDTRISGYLHLPKAPWNVSRNSIRWHGAIMWDNILAAAINPDSSEVFFTIMLKKWNLTGAFNSYLLIQNTATVIDLFLYYPAPCTPYICKLMSVIHVLLFILIVYIECCKEVHWCIFCMSWKINVINIKWNVDKGCW